MRFFVLAILMVLLSGQVSTVAASDEVGSSTEPIGLSLSLYIVDEEGSTPSSELSSSRDVESLEQVSKKMQDIWDQAGVELEVGPIVRITAPADALIDLSQGESSAFLNGVYERRIEVPDPGAINGFYVRSLGRINGFASVGPRVFFVTDEPSVHDERVSSHEIGHILGLHHEPADNAHLMFSGTNGMELSESEVAAARYVAQGIADGLR